MRIGGSHSRAEAGIRGVVMNGKEAFTLVELLVTVVVLAILAAVVLSAVVDTVDQKAEVNAREILAAVRFTKVNALTKRQMHRIVFDSVNETVRVEDDVGAAVWNPITFSTFEWTLEHGQIQSSDFDGDNYLEFGTSGEGVCGGTVVIDYNGLTQTFTISPITGRVAVEEARN